MRREPSSDLPGEPGTSRANNLQDTKLNLLQVSLFQTLIVDRFRAPPDIINN